MTNVGGTWKDLMDNVNVMAANVSVFFVMTDEDLMLTLQVQTIAVTTVCLLPSFSTLVSSCHFHR